MSAAPKVREAGREVLEGLGNAEAQEVLKMFAKVPAGARLTRESQASLERLSR